jgi:hypothetical protein
LVLQKNNYASKGEEVMPRKTKKKIPLLRKIRKILIERSGGRTVGTQEKQIRELGLGNGKMQKVFKKKKRLKRRK